MGITVVMDDVSRRFGKRSALGKVSVSAEPERVLLVTGQNGTGKSTLLKIAAGIIRPSTGKVVYKDGSSEGLPSAFSTKIGFVSPELSLYDELSAIDNLTFFGRLKGVCEPMAKAEALLKKVGLLDRADDAIGEFSSGMRQRVKYCFSLINDPDVWILDEPTANLDEPGKELVHSLIRERRSGRTVIVATNEKEEVALGDDLILLGR